MKRKLLLAALVVASAFAFNANAREDVTSTYLQDADLSSLVGWGDPGRTDWRTNGATNVVEFWNWTNQFNFSQTATLPAGYYRLAVNAFYRNSWGGDGTNNNMAWIFAGEKTQNVVALTSMSELSGYAGSNDLYRAATAFSQGKYSNEFDFDVTGEGTTEVEIGFRGTCPNGGWCILGPVTLYKYTADDYKDDYRAKVTAAEALYDTPMWTADLAALQAAVVDENTLTTVDEVKSAITNLSNAINAANSSIVSYAAAIAPFNKVKAQADAIAAVEYTETTAGSHDTFIAAIATQQTAATNATDAAAITAAITALKDAVKAYVNAAEPKNDGEYFDITCLMANPDFDDNNINGWTKESTLNPNTRIQCNEFFGSAAFDFYQTITGLPNGSFTLSMKAFQRPGWYDGVYADYANGINNATAKIYVNSDESDVMNIMVEMNDTRIYTDPAGEDAFNTDKQPQNAPGFIPNSMEGAAAWFAAGKYQTEVAALVEDGTLRLGFKDEAHSGDVWTLFDEFRLHYYGSSKMIYYKQYLPQLIAEVEADKSNALYTNVTGKELSDLNAALGVDASGFTTEQQYSDAINAIKDAQTAYRAAYPSYNAFVAVKAEGKLDKISTNIGDGVFQYNATTNDNLYTVYETAYNTMMATSADYSENPYATAANINTALAAYNTRKAAYQNQELNAPANGQKYNIIVATEGHAKAGNAIVIVPGETSDNNPSGYGLNANFAPNANLAQAVTFTKVSGNDYTINFVTAEGTAYLTYGTTNGSAAGWSDSQIQATTDASKVGEFTIVATTTDNVFNIVNKITNANIDCQENGNIYTDADITLDGFSVAEASQASVAINTTAAGWGTVMFPFAIDKPNNGVKFYSVSEVNNLVLKLDEVDALEANKPYIIEGVWEETLTGRWGIAGATSYEDGLLTGVYVNTPAILDTYVLQKPKNGGAVGFYKVETEGITTVTPNHAYLDLNNIKPTDDAKARAFFFDGDVTAIEAISAIAAGEIEAIYTTGGAQVQSLQKGMNIVVLKNGQTQKVFVK